MTKLYVGLVGENGAGKGTVASIIQARIKTLTVGHITFSSVLRETLEIYDIPLTKHNFQVVIVALEKEFGQGLLTRAVRKRALAMNKDIVILDGVRWYTDLHMVRDFKDNLLVYVTADPELRYQRRKARKEKVSEDVMSWEQFCEEEIAENEVYVADIGKKHADVKISNNGSQFQLVNDVVKLVEQRIISRKTV